MTQWTKVSLLFLGEGIMILILGTLPGAAQLLFVQEQEILPLIRVEDQRFGVAVSLAGDIAILGATDYVPGSASVPGEVQVFRRSGAFWEHEDTISIGVRGDAFGSALTISGNELIIGAPLWVEPGGGAPGAVFFFRFENDQWVESQGAITGIGGRFGDSVAASSDGQLLVVGAPFDEGSRGTAYIYRRTGGVWELDLRVLAGDGDKNELFGDSVGVDGSVVMVGMTRDEGVGSVHVFEFIKDVWVQREEPLSGDVTGSGDEFGQALVVEGDVVVIGSPGDNEGSAYVFRRLGNDWVQEQRLAARFGNLGDGFGDSVALSSGVIVVGAGAGDGRNVGSGGAYAYRDHGGIWAEDQLLFADDGMAGDEFGGAGGRAFDDVVALDSSGLLVGANRHEEGGVRSGAAYYYRRVDGESCLAGSVNQGMGPLSNVLYVNGSIGDQGRVVEVASNDLISLVMLSPPAGSNGRFVLQGHLGTPVAPGVALPFDVGVSCFPLLLSAGSEPVIVANNLGRTNLVGASVFFGVPTQDPGRAPTAFFYDPLPAGSALTFQGIIVDQGSAGVRPVSVTNAVIVLVRP